MSTIFDVILLYGPKYVGKTAYFHKHLASTHQLVCPADLFGENPDLTLHQLIHKHVVGPLEQGHKIVIDEGFLSCKIRQSYVHLIQKKLPSARLQCLVFQPSGGSKQLDWAHQFCLAEQVLSGHPWLHDELDSVLKGQEDIPQECEGFNVKSVSTVLTISSPYKFNIPALFVQWECLFDKSKTDVSADTDTISVVLDFWCKANPIGRIIIIHDGNANFAVSGRHLRNTLPSIVQKMDGCPVYLIRLTDPSSCFCQPPNPGMLAFLLRLHHIDRQNQATMYWYHTESHKKMANNAGIRHIKASRVFQHHHMASSSHATVIPPALLTIHHILIPEQQQQQHLPADVPLLHATADDEDGVVKMRHLTLCGRTLYLVSKSEHHLTQYNNLYRTHATSGSGVITQYIGKSAAEPLGNAPRGKSRELPEWMKVIQPQKKPKLKVSSPSSSRREDDEQRFSPPEGKTSQCATTTTIYVMSDEELVEMAKYILNQDSEQKIDITSPLSHRKQDDHVVCHEEKANILSPKIAKQDVDTMSDILDDLFSSPGNMTAKCPPTRQRPTQKLPILHLEENDDDAIWSEAGTSPN